MVIPSDVPHIALFSSPGFGHLIPMIELAKRLATHHSVTATIFVVSTDSHPAETHLLNSAAASGLFQVNILPRSTTLIFPPDADILTRITLMIRSTLPLLRYALAGLSTRPTALVVDLFGTEAMKIADEFQMLKYVFFPSNARFLAFTVFTPHLGPLSPAEPLEMPGCDPIPFECLPKEVGDLDADTTANREFERIVIDISTADGVLINTWEDLERRTLDSFRTEGLMKPVIKAPVHGIGPLVRRGGRSGCRSELVEWLDKQPAESVLYVSFGTGGTLTTKQTVEIAFGLEKSQQRFVWVFRTPIDYDASASVYLDQSNGLTDELEYGASRYLPEGFLDRTQKVGRVVPNWAPQEEILAHPAVGGFLSHCGWNSVLESLINGVPLIGWPLYAEQGMNAAMLADIIGVASRPSVNPSVELIGREGIEEMIRNLMVGKEGVRFRLRAKELQKSGDKALSEGGTSCEALCKFVQDCQVSL
ncbi:hypothetical protein Dimus_017660 [Dionaea muscipula]